MTRIEVCQCGVEFVQRKHHETGKLNPICREPVENGNVAVLPDGRYRIIKKGEEYEGPRFVSHFSNCQYAKSFKRS